MSKKKMRVGILEVGRMPNELSPKHGDYPTMVADWLVPLKADFQTYAVLDNQLPTGPGEQDLWVIAGSRFAVYETHLWVAPLEDFVRSCHADSVKMVGVCFGHQIIAQALGGRVEKSNKGWGIGIHEYLPVDWPGALGTAPKTIRMQAFHQDQVVDLPESATRIAGSDFCENAALWYPGFAISVQGHPEFGKPYARDLLINRRGGVLGEGEVDIALASMADDTTRHALALLIRDKLGSI